MPRRLSRLDAAIAAISPGWAARRARSRLALHGLTRANALYDGATRGRRAGTRIFRGTDGNAEARTALHALRDAARDLVRNNPYATRGVAAIDHNVIGTGIIPSVKGPHARKINAAMLRFFDTPECDADGTHDLYGLQGLAVRSMVEAGEVLIRRRYRRAADGLTVPMQIQLLEPDFLDMTRDGMVPTGGFIIQGVEFDALGRRAAYWLYDTHPGGTVIGRRPVSHRVPARDVIHLRRVDRIGQVRGIPWLAPVILRLRDFDEYEDAQLMRQKIAACFTAFVREVDGAPAALAATAPGGDGTGPETELGPGLIEHLPPGTDVSFANPPGVDGYPDFASVSLHGIAAGLQVTYEVLTGDLKGVNFSSGRMGWLEFQRSIDVWRWRTVIPQLCRGVERWFRDAALLAGLDATRTVWSWTPPRREMIDPTREVPAKRDEIRAGLITLSEAIRERGFDPEAHFDEYATDIATLDRLGITLDSDARAPAAGSGRPHTGDENESDEEPEEDERTDDDT